MATATRTRKATIRIVVLRAPGTNCDEETGYAFERQGAQIQHLHVNALLKKPTVLGRAHGLILPGGFSYGDDLGAGTVLGTTLRHKLRDSVLKMVDRGGIVLGICNGFQILVKTGLLPGFGEEQSVALASNVQNRYEDRWVTLRADATNVFFKEGDIIRCPIAHAEGRFLVADNGVKKQLESNGQIALRYVTVDGESPAPYPFNPNGSTDDIAGITDPTGRILGLMPHPERNQFPWQDTRFHAGTAPRTPEGLLPFKNAMSHLKKTFG